jgi:hypothetical protein
MHLSLKVSKTIVLSLLGFVLLFSLCLKSFYFDRKLKEQSMKEILASVTISDLIAMVFWDKDNSQDILDQIWEEKNTQRRDQVHFPTKHF